MVTLFEIAGLLVTHVSPEVISHRTTSPLLGLYVNVALVAPGASMPFIFQRKAGVTPPFTGVDVNVTWVPAHIPFADGVIVMLAVSDGLTVIVSVLEVAGFPMLHGSLEASKQTTRSPSTGV